MDTRQKITEHLGTSLIGVQERTPKRVYFCLSASHLVAAADFLFNTLRLRFITATAVDVPEGFEILYHFSEDATGIIYSLCLALTDKEHPRAPSLSKLIIGASWIEREIHELMGIDFPGNENLKHLLLAEDWPQGNYPLRQEKK